MKTINTENSLEHWEFVDVKNKIVLDLGCGRWEKVEKVDSSWLTTPEYFIYKGASKVIALDIDIEEINWFNNRFNNNAQYLFLLQGIDSVENLYSLYKTYQPQCVKCDIEGAEKFLLEMDKQIFMNVNEYYIETHGNSMYSLFTDLFAQYGYKTREIIDLSHTNGYCKVIFAYK